MLPDFSMVKGCLMAFIQDTKDGYDGKCFRVHIVNTDRAVIYWMKEKFGGNVYEQDPGGGQRRSFRWHINGRTAFDFIQAIYPYSIIKKTQIEVGMYFFRLDRSNRAEHDLLTELLKREKRREDESITPPKPRRKVTLDDL